MTMLQYDGSYEGLLTAIFEVYEYKIASPSIQRAGQVNGSLFGHTHVVHTDTRKSERVYKKLKERLSLRPLNQLFDCFLSEQKDMENVLLRYVQYALSSKQAIENDYSNPDVLFIQQTSRKVHREKHRMEAFVRFELTKDQLYYSIIQPDYNILPLISKHFSARYADQRWLIYDALRKYGLYYDGNQVQEVQLNFAADLQNSESKQAVYDANELLYQQLWQQYFSSVNIAARRNMKLHIQHMPKRYWRYLVEKQPGK